jgi:hypothetical protein
MAIIPIVRRIEMKRGSKLPRKNPINENRR